MNKLVVISLTIGSIVIITVAGIILYITNKNPDLGNSVDESQTIIGYDRYPADNICGKFGVYKEDGLQKKWEGALDYCENLCEGCRLPSKEELQCICQNKKAFGDNFTNNYYWSADEKDSSKAYAINFQDCSVTTGSDKTYQDSVRCVDGEKKNLAETIEIKGSMNDLMSRGKDLICTYDTAEVYGTHYISHSWKKIRAEGFSKKEKQFEWYMIFDYEKNIIINWTKNIVANTPVEVGFKYTFPKEESLKNFSQYGQSPQSQTNPNEEYNYKCKIWSPVDDSKFIPPGNVKFQDMGEFLNVQDTMNVLNSGM